MRKYNSILNKENPIKIYSDTKTGDKVMNKIYEQLREKWTNKLTGNKVVDKLDLDYQCAMKELDEQAMSLWETMKKEIEEKEERKELWAGLDVVSSPADANKVIRYLEVMATAYASMGCKLYKNNVLKKDLIEALEWFYKYAYNEHITMIANWWNWDIGIPQALCNVIVLLYEELPKDYIERQLITLQRFNPTPFAVPGGPKMTGANLLDTAVVSAMKAIIGENEIGLSEARDSISDVLPYVTSGDGFYVDGSFIQHHTVPYAGGYGAVLMECMAKLLFILDETPWSVTDPLIGNVYNWITESFAPLYHQGAIMDMVGGRGISRDFLDDHKRGRGILAPMLELSYTAPKEKALEIQSYIKENISRDKTFKNYYTGLAVTDILNIKSLLADQTVPARGDLELHKVYGSMDRVVHHTQGWSVGISMFSSRIDNFEYGNGENTKGYHTADGMVSLYNDDQKQFGEHYWPTADMMRLPGTTTDKSPGSLVDWRGFRSQQDWVGGTCLTDRWGASGMILEMEQSSLVAKKSWFCLDNQIVCLGADICAQDNQLVETIVENRKIKESGDNQLVVNGKVIDATFDQEEKLVDVKWAWLEGNIEGGQSDIGYYFPENTELVTLREKRTGSWREINRDGSTELVSKNYISLAVAHGDNPVKEKYSYILLPNYSKEEVEAYSQKEEDIVIIANTEVAQGVSYKSEQILAINFWEAAEVAGIKAQMPMTMILRETTQEVQLALADPTQKQTTIEVVLLGKAYELIEADEKVTSMQTTEGTKIIVDTRDSAGKTYSIKLR